LLPAAKPEVIVKQLTADHEFIVLACDGEVMEGGCGYYSRDYRDMGCDDK